MTATLGFCVLIHTRPLKHTRSQLCTPVNSHTLVIKVMCDSSTDSTSDRNCCNISPLVKPKLKHLPFTISEAMREKAMSRCVKAMLFVAVPLMIFLLSPS